jgi:hypothetical protein
LHQEILKEFIFYINLKLEELAVFLHGVVKVEQRWCENECELQYTQKDKRQKTKYKSDSEKE